MRLRIRAISRHSRATGRFRACCCTESVHRSATRVGSRSPIPTCIASSGPATDSRTGASGADVAVDGATVLLGIIADPVTQARTPGLLNAALAQRRVNAVLVPMHVHAGDLRAAIEGLRAIRNFAGAVISMPHKRTITTMLDEVK